jgi:hypothetical protein
MRTYQRTIVSLFAVAITLACACGDGGGLQGSGMLPDCSEAPDFNLDRTTWYNQEGGRVLIQSEGCEGLSRGDELRACALTWAFSQTDSEVDITVDPEDDAYPVKGRLCGSELHLEGGWWLWAISEEAWVREGERCPPWSPASEDDGEEVTIEEGGNTLVVEEADGGFGLTASGTLALKGPCEARYEITLIER